MKANPTLNLLNQDLKDKITDNYKNYQVTYPIDLSNVLKDTKLSTDQIINIIKDCIIIEIQQGYKPELIDYKYIARFVYQISNYKDSQTI